MSRHRQKPLKRIAYLYHRFRSIYSYRNDIAPRLEKPLISFTFDDFPVSAAEKGADLLDTYGVRGTFYASFGLSGRQTIVGKISDASHMARLIQRGHEIGDHTFDHSDALEVSSGRFEESILKNRSYLKAHYPDLEFATFAYPYGYLEFGTKKIAQKYYGCSRSAWKGINHGRIDLNLLRSFPLLGDLSSFKAVKRLVDRNLRLNGWLIFFTHDVDERPSDCGCSPGLLEEVLKYAVDTGTTVLNVDQARNLLLTLLASYRRLKGDKNP